MRRSLFLLFMLASLETLQAQSFSKNQALADLDFMMQKIEEVHYNPYLFISREALNRKRDSLVATLPDSIGFRQLVSFLSKITALLEDGHTAPSFVQGALRPQFGRPVFFPLAVWQESGQLFAQPGVLPAGARIDAINGHRADSLLQDYRSGIGGTGAYKSELAARLFSRHLHLSAIEAPFRIRYTHEGKTKDTLLAEGLGFGKSLGLALPHIGGPAYTFRIIDKKLGYLDFKAMSGAPERFMKYLDSAFGEMRRQKIRSFAVDLRDNTGGNSLMADVLISYFFQKPYTLMGKRFWKISRSYQEQLLRNGDSGSAYLSQAHGSIWERGNCGRYDPKVSVDTPFTGRVYLITGPLTFSSANMLADGFKEFRMGTIVGEPTGENTNDFGETLSLTLPNSGIEITTTTSYDIGAGCDPKAVHTVQPDVLIRTPVRERAQGRDWALAWILKKAQ